MSSQPKFSFHKQIDEVDDRIIAHFVMSLNLKLVQLEIRPTHQSQYRPHPPNRLERSNQIRSKVDLTWVIAAVYQSGAMQAPVGVIWQIRLRVGIFQ